jgi:WD40 repeat protein
LLRRQGTEKAIRASAATAITLNSKYIIVATDEKVEVYSPAGDLLRRFNSDIGLGALAVDGDRLALGYREGNVELLNLSTGKLSKDPMENVPSSPVVSLLFAPSGTLAAGYADGSVALWSLSSGALLNRGKLHGPVTHLELHENRILAASVLGTHLSWDLSSLNKRYCDLVNEVWDTVPVVWRDGEPQIARPSGKYPCPKKGE